MMSDEEFEMYIQKHNIILSDKMREFFRMYRRLAKLLEDKENVDYLKKLCREDPEKHKVMQKLSDSLDKIFKRPEKSDSLDENNTNEVKRKLRQ